MTFEREVMAGLCLAVVWVNSGLIVAHGWRDLRRLGSLRRRLAGTVGRLGAVAADGGPRFRLVQTGRTRGDGSIYFHDRHAECSFQGEGWAETRQGRFDLELASGGVWVWPTTEEIAQATRCASQAEFDALAGPALHARGAERVAMVHLSDAANVAGGRVTGTLLRGDSASPLIFSSDDPRARLLGLELRVASVLLGIVAALAVLTALCFVGPAFGSVSVLGALGLFAYFLLVQPVGVWLSESVRFPHEARYGGVWIRRRLPGSARYEVGSRVTTS